MRLRVGKWMQDKCVSSFCPFFSCSLILICNLNTTLLNNKISLQTGKECQKVFMSIWLAPCNEREREDVSEQSSCVRVCGIRSTPLFSSWVLPFTICVCTHRTKNKYSYTQPEFILCTQKRAPSTMLFIFIRNIEKFQGTCMLTLHIFLLGVPCELN